MNATIMLTDADLIEVASDSGFDELMDTTAVARRPLGLSPLAAAGPARNADAEAAFVADAEEWAERIPTRPSEPVQVAEGRVNRRLNVLLTERLDDAVAEAAKEQGVSQSEIVRRALRVLLEQQRKSRAANTRAI